MPEETAAAVKGTCFVVMGFGKKTDFETSRTLDLDKTYEYIIKPAVGDAGLKCVRADEIKHSGLIDVPMYEQLLNADVVVADLSTSNKNAFYELGVRHALRPATTIVICEDGVKTPPFDVNHVLIRQYHHMGEGIDFGEVQRVRKLLADAIKEIYAKDPRPKDSPVYTFLNNLTPPEWRRVVEGVAEAAAKASPEAAAGGAQASGLSYSEMMKEVDEAQSGGHFDEARALLTRLRRKMKEAAGKADEEARRKGIKDIPQRAEDPCLIQRLALVTYKGAESKVEEAEAAGGTLTPEDRKELKEALRKGCEEARALLLPLAPRTSNDPETLGLWGAVHKRLWETTADTDYLDEAVRSYERGFYLRRDHYNGINLAFLLNVRADTACERADPAASADETAAWRAEAVSCFVHAGHVREQVLSICEERLKTEKLTDEQKYWVLATMAEAHLGVGDEAAARRKLDEAFALPPAADWMKQTTEEQMDELRRLLADSPLRYIRTDGA
jgi:hypothetical protein